MPIILQLYRTIYMGKNKHYQHIIYAVNNIQKHSREIVRRHWPRLLSISDETQSILEVAKVTEEIKGHSSHYLFYIFKRGDDPSKFFIEGYMCSIFPAKSTPMCADSFYLITKICVCKLSLNYISSTSFFSYIILNLRLLLLNILRTIVQITF